MFGLSATVRGISRDSPSSDWMELTVGISSVGISAAPSTPRVGPLSRPASSCTAVCATDPSSACGRPAGSRFRYVVAFQITSSPTVIWRVTGCMPAVGMRMASASPEPERMSKPNLRSSPGAGAVSSGTTSREPTAVDLGACRVRSCPSPARNCSVGDRRSPSTGRIRCLTVQVSSASSGIDPGTRISTLKVPSAATQGVTASICTAPEGSWPGAADAEGLSPNCVSTTAAIRTSGNRTTRGNDPVPAGPGGPTVLLTRCSTTTPRGRSAWPRNPGGGRATGRPCCSPAC